MEGDHSSDSQDISDPKGWKFSQDNKVALFGHSLSFLSIIAVGISIFIGFNSNKEALDTSRSIHENEKRREFHYWKFNKLNELNSQKTKIMNTNFPSKADVFRLQPVEISSAKIENLDMIMEKIASDEKFSKSLARLCWENRFLFRDKDRYIIENIQMSYDVIISQQDENGYFRMQDQADQEERVSTLEHIREIYTVKTPLASPIDEPKEWHVYEGTMIPSRVFDALSKILQQETKETMRALQSIEQ